MPMRGSSFRPIILAFWLSTIMNRAVCTFHPPDSIVTISRLLGCIDSPL